MFLALPAPPFFLSFSPSPLLSRKLAQRGVSTPGLHRSRKSNSPRSPLLTPSCVWVLRAACAVSLGAGGPTSLEPVMVGEPLQARAQTFTRAYGSGCDGSKWTRIAVSIERLLTYITATHKVLHLLPHWHTSPRLPAPTLAS